MSTASQVAPLMTGATCASSAPSPSSAENWPTTIGVAAYGEIQLTRTPWLGSPRRRANLDTAYLYVPSPPRTPLMLAMRGMDPAPAPLPTGGAMTRVACSLMPASIPRTFTDMTAIRDVPGDSGLHDASAVEHHVQPAGPRHGGVHGRGDGSSAVTSQCRKQAIGLSS
ncbi:hypothetical protein BS78_05G153300 [Paspalum vaginatum]|nr:hypothetical protein BS78_05G153300 [Paspalum vaginatum]